MHSLLTVGAVLAATISSVSANGCSGGTAQELGGNWYCEGAPVDSLTYTNFGSSGSYNEVTGFNGGSCASAPRSYEGALAPLDDEHSVHLRGPADLKKFAFYSLDGLLDKRELKPTIHERRHAHGHHHHAARSNVWKKVKGPNDPDPVLPIKAPEEAGAGEFGRRAFYDAATGTADGLVFLNNHGGEGSGIFDYIFGNSLSYASSDLSSGSSSPQVLKDITIPDNKEVILMSDKKCEGGCGAVRPGTVDYHGFAGKTKLYLFELAMPLSGQTGFNADMPALWILNAQIPRTLQYGKAECSCWKSGCGEFDILEVLDSGNHRCKSTFHGQVAGGSSYYFERPTGAPIKVAVLFDPASSSATIKIMGNDLEFGPVISAATVGQIQEAASTGQVFTLGA